MRSLFIDIGNTVGRALNLSDLTTSSILSILDISRSWYYRYLDPDPALDRRFNSSAVRDGDEWIVIGFKHRNPRMSHREIAYTLMDGDIAYLSPSISVSDTEKARSRNTVEAPDMGIHEA